MQLRPVKRAADALRPFAYRNSDAAAVFEKQVGEAVRQPRGVAGCKRVRSSGTASLINVARPQVARSPRSGSHRDRLDVVTREQVRLPGKRIRHDRAHYRATRGTGTA